MTTASTDPIAALWREARAWLAQALDDFCGPVGVARTLASAAHAAIKRRLALLEALVMKLLLIEATRLPQPPRPIRRASAEAGMGSAGARVGASEDPATPETWRVRLRPRFRGAPRAPRALRAGGLRPDTGAEWTYARARIKALKLARRFEALRRVIADPRRAIAALARKLHALGAAARAFAHSIALASPRQGGGLLFADAMVRAYHAAFGLPCDTT
jgi:hypothetical protein